MRTFTPKASEITRSWYLIDAQDVVLGRLATHAANLLRGKHKTTFAPHMDMGDFVIDGDKEKALQDAQEIFDLGADSKLVLQDMLEVIYLISRSKSFGKIENDLTVSESESDVILGLSKNIDFSYISMIWQFILKGIEELSFVPNHFLSFQMLIMRLVHLKDLPSPEQVIEDALNSDTRAMSESTEKQDDFNEIKPGTIINKQTSAKAE